MVYGHGRRCAVSRRPDTRAARISGENLRPLLAGQENYCRSFGARACVCAGNIFARVFADFVTSFRSLLFFIIIPSTPLTTVRVQNHAQTPLQTSRWTPKLPLRFRLGRRNRLRPHHLTAERSTGTSLHPPTNFTRRLFFAVTR